MLYALNGVDKKNGIAICDTTARLDLLAEEQRRFSLFGDPSPYPTFKLPAELLAIQIFAEAYRGADYVYLHTYKSTGVKA